MHKQGQSDTKQAKARSQPREHPTEAHKATDTGPGPEQESDQERHTHRRWLKIPSEQGGNTGEDHDQERSRFYGSQMFLRNQTVEDCKVMEACRYQSERRGLEVRVAGKIEGHDVDEVTRLNST
ncbi:MAG: hypothetical protein ACK55Z_09575, partial [bacterium]